MQGRDTFAQREAQEIRALLARKVSAGRNEQKGIRGKLRRGYGFYISDFSAFPGFGPADFDRLIASGRVRIIGAGQIGAAAEKLQPAARTGVHIKAGTSGRDEDYVLDLCDHLLGRKALRQHRFGFLVGDTGRSLPVDAYYPDLQLAIEYREIQHTESVDFFDRRNTVSGVPRGEQRRRYDERRRQQLPKHGLTLVEIPYSDLAHSGSKRLKRDRPHDEAVLHRLLARWLAPK